MRLLTTSIEEQRFSEGEPDLEPPEEMAIGELDEEAQLEEGLDNEDVLEQDVDETVLEETLEDLLRSENGDDDEGVITAGWLPEAARADDAEELEDLEELEESLDDILNRRTASEDIEDEHDGPLPDVIEGLPLRGGDEFVCRSCFLVQSISLLADADALTCHDCAT